ncbi:hypothetical protein [Burkholderia vietnamiensis]|uniref:hypothetical protein n=1 Tax=Burkholderia vietnamiensis TaxID=60552 RepID=UPI00158EBBBC|nr:hypothetical protein [Burkholderia vietnamiensis]
MMVKLGKHEIVNTMHVTHAHIDNYGDTTLVVELVTGRTIRVRHTAHCYDGFDAYAALDQILAARAE